MSSTLSGIPPFKMKLLLTIKGLSRPLESTDTGRQAPTSGLAHVAAPGVDAGPSAWASQASNLWAAKGGIRGVRSKDQTIETPPPRLLYCRFSLPSRLLHRSHFKFFLLLLSSVLVIVFSNKVPPRTATFLRPHQPSFRTTRNAVSGWGPATTCP